MPRLVQGRRPVGAARPDDSVNEDVSGLNDRDDDPPAGTPVLDESEEDENVHVDRDESVESQLITKLVRYALACEYARIPIRKEGVKEKVLGPHSRSFRRIYEGAQAQLKTVFGMELVEMPVRDRATMTVDEKRKTGKTQPQGNSVSNSYMLVSRLPDAFRSATILAPARIQSQVEEAQYMGLYSTIVSVITLSGGELSHARLQRHLGRLNARENMPMDKTENVLNKMIKQGYLVRVKNKGVAGEEDSVTWYVGPRAKLELSPEAIAGFVREVYGAPSEELEQRLQASLKVRPREVDAPVTDRSGNNEGEEEGGEEAANGEPSRPRRSGRRRAAQESDGEEEEG